MERIFDTHAHYFDKKFETVEGAPLLFLIANYYDLDMLAAYS